MADAPLDIRGLAVDVFGSREAADRWLNRPLSILDGKSPLEIACSERGALFVAQMLAKIDWGAAA
ncbi:MbcA/ParS/Xre antitoxin family protein [Bradyrhizobium sp.]|jgi:putative toxin-antitoxin system antitoxin component (TIGR02293 family)|uniref:MbcA/ParS/Xre antitoxin family protein n=1 Tax=Bradyrhizobium sp. TaxID=376 RepID=UPI002B98DD3B|nr:MbcA/ParS/Xre antitoxin family protein [Bradyrhizobium sp.]HWX58739.1 MbcA/ParS/Xre antitoxin family protein [Bradyrhizobium sp.]